MSPTTFPTVICICNKQTPPASTPPDWKLLCSECRIEQHTICMGLYGIVLSHDYVCHFCSSQMDEDLIDVTTGDRAVKSAHLQTLLALRNDEEIWKVREKRYWESLSTSETAALNADPTLGLSSEETVVQSSEYHKGVDMQEVNEMGREGDDDEVQSRKMKNESCCATT